MLLHKAVDILSYKENCTRIILDLDLPFMFFTFVYFENILLLQKSVPLPGGVVLDVTCVCRYLFSLSAFPIYPLNCALWMFEYSHSPGAPVSVSSDGLVFLSHCLCFLCLFLQAYLSKNFIFS